MNICIDKTNYQWLKSFDWLGAVDEILVIYPFSSYTNVELWHHHWISKTHTYSYDFMGQFRRILNTYKLWTYDVSAIDVVFGLGRYKTNHCLNNFYILREPANSIIVYCWSTKYWPYGTYLGNNNFHVSLRTRLNFLINFLNSSFYIHDRFFTYAT